MTDKNISKKISALNKSLSEINQNDLIIDSEKEKSIISSDLTKTGNKLNDIIKNKNIDEKEVQQIMVEMSEESAKEMEDLNAWKNEQIEKLSAISNNIIAKVADLLPSIPSVPDVVQQALDKIEKTKTEVEEKILNAQIRINIKQNIKMTELIKKS